MFSEGWFSCLKIARAASRELISGSDFGAEDRCNVQCPNRRVAGTFADGAELGVVSVSDLDRLLVTFH